MIAVRPSAMSSLPVREYTRRRVVDYAARSHQTLDQALLGLLDHATWSPPRPAIELVPVTPCEDPHVARDGTIVLCRRSPDGSPHPGRLHCWWNSNIPGSREEWA